MDKALVLCALLMSSLMPFRMLAFASALTVYAESMKRSVETLFSNPMDIVWRNPGEHRALLGTAAVGAGSLAGIYLFARYRRSCTTEKKDNVVESHVVNNESLIQQSQVQQQAFILLRELSYQDVVLLPEEEQDVLKSLLAELNAHDAAERFVIQQQNRLNVIPITDETPPDLREQREREKEQIISARVSAKQQLQDCKEQLITRADEIRIVHNTIKQRLIACIRAGTAYVQQDIEGGELMREYRADACARLAGIPALQEDDINTLSMSAIRQTDKDVQIIERIYEQLMMSAPKKQELLKRIRACREHIMRPTIYASIADDEERSLNIERYNTFKGMITGVLSGYRDRTIVEFHKAEQYIKDYQKTVSQQEVSNDMSIERLQKLLDEMLALRRKYDTSAEILKNICSEWNFEYYSRIAAAYSKS